MRISERLLSHFAFLSVGLVSLLLAVFLASQLTKRSLSQTSPPAATSPQGAAESQVDGAEQVSSAAASDESAPDSAATDAAASDVASPVAEVDASALTADTFLEPYIYDLRDGRRNPFKAPTAFDGGSAESLLPGTPLERYDINELKLIGIMWDVKNPKAMFQDPAGAVHTLSKDDRIGRKRGYVALIREGEVVVVETTTFGNESQLATTILRIER